MCIVLGGLVLTSSKPVPAPATPTMKKTAGGFGSNVTVYEYRSSEGYLYIIVQGNGALDPCPCSGNFLLSRISITLALQSKQHAEQLRIPFHGRPHDERTSQATTNHQGNQTPRHLDLVPDRDVRPLHPLASRIRILLNLKII